MIPEIRAVSLALLLALSLALSLPIALSGCARPAPPPPPVAVVDLGPPARARYFVLAAAWREQQGDLPGAIQAIRSALLHDPGDPWLLQRLAALEARAARPAPTSTLNPAPNPVSPPQEAP